MELKDLPSNSHKSKQTEQVKVTVEEPKQADNPLKSLIGDFLHLDAKSIATSVVKSYIAPGIKRTMLGVGDTIGESVKGVFREMVGDIPSGSSVPASQVKVYTNYNSMSRSSSSYSQSRGVITAPSVAPSPQPVASRGVRMQPYVLYDSVEDANDVLQAMKNDIEASTTYDEAGNIFDMGYTTLAQMFDFSGKTALMKNTDYNWGWHDLSTASIYQTTDPNGDIKWALRLPKCEPIK